MDVALGVTRVAAVGIGTRNSRVEGEAGRAAYKKLRVEVSLTSLNVWSHQAVPNKRGAAIFAPLAPEKYQAQPPTFFQRQKDVGCQGDVEEHQCAGSHLGAGVTGVRPQDGTLVFHHFMQGAFLIEFQL